MAQADDAAGLVDGDTNAAMRRAFDQRPCGRPTATRSRMRGGFALEPRPRDQIACE